MLIYSLATQRGVETKRSCAKKRIYCPEIRLLQILQGGRREKEGELEMGKNERERGRGLNPRHLFVFCPSSGCHWYCVIYFPVDSKPQRSDWHWVSCRKFYMVAKLYSRHANTSCPRCVSHRLRKEKGWNTKKTGSGITGRRMSLRLKRSHSGASHHYANWFSLTTVSGGGSPLTTTAGTTGRLEVSIAIVLFIGNRSNP